MLYSVGTCIWIIRQHNIWLPQWWSNSTCNPPKDCVFWNHVTWFDWTYMYMHQVIYYENNIKKISLYWLEHHISANRIYSLILNILGLLWRHYVRIKRKGFFRIKLLASISNYIRHLAFWLIHFVVTHTNLHIFYIENIIVKTRFLWPIQV